MGCRRLQLQDYFQLVENDPIKYRRARFIKGIPVYFTYTKYNQLESKSFGAQCSLGILPENSTGNTGSLSRPISYVRYFYAREVNGSKQNYKYDLKNQLTAVKDTQGNIIEQYSYDLAGNILKKSVRADSISAPVITTYEHDAANQLVSSALRYPSA